ncbi:MAG: FAD-binding protein [Micrococcales bacterium]|nr:FAD-binding protein [Micrococcales bacterium]
MSRVVARPAVTPDPAVPRGGGLERDDAFRAEMETRGVWVNEDGCEADNLAFCGGVTVRIGAGEVWDDIVTLAVSREWVGVEALAGIPGRVGDAAMRNASAHGQRVGDTVASVRTWDRVAGAQRTFAMVDCEFGDAQSRFTRERLEDGTRRYVVLEVSFLLRQGDLSMPIQDPRLADALGVRVGQRAETAQTRRAVLALRGTDG